MTDRRAWLGEGAKRCRTGGRRRARVCVLWFAALMFLIVPLVSRAAQAAPVSSKAEMSVQDGFARLLVHFASDVEAKARLSGQILIVEFGKPVDMSVERLQEGAPDFVSVARRDPDGMALRMALTRKVTINTIVAGERLFVDLLPEGWTGPPPGLPDDVVRELAERARNAERKLRRHAATPDEAAPSRVRIANQPTFSRYVFELPAGVGASVELKGERLSVQFDRVLKFDLTEPTANAPPSVTNLSQAVDDGVTRVEFALVGEVDVSSFREDTNLAVDLRFKPKPENGMKLQSTPKPQTAAEPPSLAGRGADAKPAPDAPAPQMAAAPAIAPPTPSPSPSPSQPAPASASAAPPAPDKPTAETPAAQKPAAAEAKAEKPSVEKQADAPAPKSGAHASPLVMAVDRSGGRTALKFPFVRQTPAAMFRRGDYLWLVFDTREAIDLSQLSGEAGKDIVEARQFDVDDGVAIRFRFAGPYLASLTAMREEWTLTVADDVVSPAEPLMIQRNVVEPTRANISIPFVGAARVRSIVDPDIGDAISVITASAPVRGFIKPQNLVGLQILHSMQGVAIVPQVESIRIELASDKITIGRPGGLVLSATVTAPDQYAVAVKTTFDADEWRANIRAPFPERLEKLMQEASRAEPKNATAARMKLARFYIARGMAAEAKGVMDVAIGAMKKGEEDPDALVLRAVANILFDRPEAALDDLRKPAVGTSYDSQLWKAMIYARQGKWGDARENFKNVEFAISSLPIDLQRMAVMDAMRAALEVKDYESASRRANELEIVGIGERDRPRATILRGRLAESIGRFSDALNEYRAAGASDDRMAAAEAQVRLVALELARKATTPEAALDTLEGLAVTWRGDDTEMRTLQLLFSLYADAGRYRDALTASRTASRLKPDSEVTRALHDDAQALFTSIFLDDKAKSLSVVDTLTLFYEFRDLTPIGRRGDELIRRLADRLVDADLLEQASELLQYQVDHRLQGAARAQVATRLAMIYLMSRKPDRAIAVLQKSRIGNLATELRQIRLLLEARAQSDIGRHDLALDIISSVQGREGIRLRSDIYWAARRWRESAEQIELLHGDRWKSDEPLTAEERSDVTRATVGYAIADDQLGQARFREKYGSKMASGEGAREFAMAAEPARDGLSNIVEISRLAASFDTLATFLRDIRERYSDGLGGRGDDAQDKGAEPATTGALPALPMKKVRTVR